MQWIERTGVCLISSLWFRVEVDTLMEYYQMQSISVLLGRILNTRSVCAF